MTSLDLLRQRRHRFHHRQVAAAAWANFGSARMKAFFSAILVATGLAIGAYYVLASQQQSASTAFSTSSVRVGDPGNNLIGVN